MNADDWPFLGRDAVRRGEITAWRLQRDYRPIYRNVYFSKQAALTALTRARAAWLWSGGNAIPTGLSAAAVLGTQWLDGDQPAGLRRLNRHSPPGIAIRTYDIADREVIVRNGIRITTAERTAFDIGRSLPLPRSIPVLDAVANATNVKIADIEALSLAKPGCRGVRRLRAALKMVDGGAESPQESRVRMLLVSAGLPPPGTQIEFADDFGLARIRVDMGWREWRVAVEYDGVQHWSDRYQRSWDIDRIAMLEAMGWTVVGSAPKCSPGRTSSSNESAPNSEQQVAPFDVERAGYVCDAGAIPSTTCTVGRGWG